MTTTNTTLAAETTVTRKLTLAEPANDQAIAHLAETFGVISVRPSADRRRLEITYRAHDTVMEALEKVASGVGLKLSNGLFARLGRRWAAFQDDNLRSQSNVVHRCCSGPPH